MISGTPSAPRPRALYRQYRRRVDRGEVRPRRTPATSPEASFRIRAVFPGEYMPQASGVQNDKHTPTETAPDTPRSFEDAARLFPSRPDPKTVYRWARYGYTIGEYTVHLEYERSGRSLYVRPSAIAKFIRELGDADRATVALRKRKKRRRQRLDN